MRLASRSQSALSPHDSLASLLASPNDGIWFLRPPQIKPRGHYLHDCGATPYVIRLVNPLLVPRRFIPPNLKFAWNALLWQLCFETSPLPTGLFYGKANLMLTSDNSIIADSLAGGTIVHPGMSYRDDQSWEVSMTGPEERIDGRFLYLEMVPKHYGHMIVDLPARLWPRREKWFADLPSLAFATHGLTPKDGLPKTAARILGAIGIRPDSVTIANQPLRVAELIVPGRIAPDRGPSGVRYNQLMQEAGNLISGGKAATAPLVFLSRSRLTSDRRPVDRKAAEQIDDLFRRHGFAIVHPKDIDLAEQIAAVRGATHLAGFTGSQLHLAAFSERPDIRMLRICPDDFVTGIDHNILAPINGQVTDVLIQRPGWLRHLMNGFRLRPGPDDLARLDTAIRDFITPRDGAA
ncbi:MAG: glycosyltransferase family 61 protein [Rhodobacterales bacterium]|nr:glycosyltransferase family 61 protein [Rhodobacterales bacterium]